MKAGWAVASLAELEDRGVLELGRGKVISKNDLEANPGAYPVYSAAKDNDGRFGEYGEFMFDEELITWTVDGGGRLFHRPRHKFSITNVGGFVRILNSERLSYRYLFYALSLLHSTVQFDWVKKAHPSVIRRVYDRIPIAPLDEQKRVVAVLDEAFEGLARACENAEANRETAGELRDRAVSEVLSDVACGQETRGLGTIAVFRNGLNFSQTSSGAAIRIVGVGDFQDRFWIPTEELKVVNIDGLVAAEDLLKGGDILAVRSNGNRDLIGRMMLSGPQEAPTSFSGFTIRIRLTSAAVRPDFLCHFLKSGAVRKLLTSGGGGANISNLNQRMLAALEIPVPPLENQKRAVDIIEDLSRRAGDVLARYTDGENDLATLRQSLLQKAFAGELT